MIAHRGPTTEEPLFAFAGGGTGGHLYPALGIAHAIRRRIPQARFVFFGTQRPIDQQILGAVDCGLVRQTLSPLSAKPWRWPGVLWGLQASHRTCREFFHDDRPAVVIGTGGLASVAPVREAHRAGIPVVILNPDAVPGRANRHLAHRAAVVFAQWEETIPHYPRSVRVEVSGCPVRAEFKTALRQMGLAHFDLRSDRRTLLVTGASQGSRTINEAVLANVDLLESASSWQILHLTGQNDHDLVARAYAGRRVAAKVIAYTENMAEALAASDLVVSRAGASTLAELSALGRPSVLMPYPFHRDQHQRANAECLARAGAARIVRDAVDANVNAPALRAVLQALMTDDDLRERMSTAARRLGRPDAAERIAEEVLRLKEGRGEFRAAESVEAMCAPSR